MHLLLTNDDGIEAPGLAALVNAAAKLPDVQISVVAPAVEQSMCGHRVTTHSPLRVAERGPGRWAVEGTPADCVRIALFGLGLRPDWVLSGVNAGGNLGQDIVISGTCAAVREATYHGLPGIAFSHYMIREIPMDWDRVSEWTRAVFTGALSAPPAADEFLSVNFPHLPPGPLPMPDVRTCHPALSPLNVSYARDSDGAFVYTARYAERPQDSGSDVEVCFGGEISLCRVPL